MKWLKVALMGVFYSSAALAADALSLNDYLTQVKARNPEARSTLENIDAFQGRLREADVPQSPEAYAHFGLLDDKKPTAQPVFMGTETQAAQWRAGLRQQTAFGLGADLYFLSQRTIMHNVSPLFMPVADYMESSAVLELTQSLWRNGFGEFTRSDIEMNKANAMASLLQSQFHLKNLLLSAQNAYWSVVSFNQIVQLQQENVERAKKLRDYMANRTRLKLFDDTDAMQAQASYESRLLELQSSLDDRASTIRQFNTLRGVDSDEIQELAGLPAKELMVDTAKGSTGRISREDFEMLRAQAKAQLAQSRGAASQIQPQLDLKASVATNGRDGITPLAYEQLSTSRYPTWSIGFNFSVPLDFGLIRDIKRGYRSMGVAARDLDDQAMFSEQRAWDDLVKQRREAQGRYERSLSVENIQTDLVKRERQRLLNGRATTFEALNFEQNLALAQIQRVRAQLVLLQIHNAIKTFEVKQ